MDTNRIKPIKKVDFYLKTAIGKADKTAAAKAFKYKDPFLSYRRIHQFKLGVFRNYLTDKLQKIISEFPSINNINNFYVELIDSTVGTTDLKKNLARIDWSRKNIDKFYREYYKKIDNATAKSQILRFKKEFYGRIKSILRQDVFDFLENARKKFRNYPVIKTGLYNVALCGFPNVGKTTIFNQLTKAKAEINSYAFTTKKLNVSYLKKDYYAAQIIDTPGTLARYNKMNHIEKQAYLVLKYVADVIVFIFDLTEEYPLEMQIKLYEKITLENANKKIYVFFAKKDLIGENKIKEFCIDHKFDIVDNYTVLKDFILKETFKRRSMF